MDDDIEKLPDRGNGPFAQSRWLTVAEYDEAYSLALRLTKDIDVEGVSLRFDPEWPEEWRRLELPWHGNSDRKIIIGLPVADGPWGPARTSGFFVVVAANPGRDAWRRP